MDIQWYPGHMDKAQKEVQSKLKQVDVVIELADARIPRSSRNPLLETIIQDKPSVIVLTKADLADPKVTEEWKQYYRDQGIEAVDVDSKHKKGLHVIKEAALQQTERLQARWKRKGIKPRAIRAMIIGIPNVGKSTLINQWIGKKTAKIGDRPGITKNQQWLKMGKEMDLLDTPGILWPKFEDPYVGERLAATGAIKDELLDLQDIAYFIIGICQEYYPEKLLQRFGLEDKPRETSLEWFEDIGRKRGALLAGAEIDYEKAGEMVVREFRGGLLGRISLERPDDEVSE